MKHISEIIEDILVEWAYRVHDGMPNPKNAQHIQQLRESMEELNLPNKVIYEVIQNLINEEENPILKKTIKYKTDDGEDKEGTVGGILKKGENHGKFINKLELWLIKTKLKRKRKKIKLTSNLLMIILVVNDEKSDKEDKPTDDKSSETKQRGDYESKQNHIKNGFVNGETW